MAKEWYEESSEEFADGFTEEHQVHHTSPNDQELETVYGPAAPFSEHKRGDHIIYSAEGLRSSGVIIWVQAPFENIGVRYVVAPDVPTGFVDFVVPGDVVTQEQPSEELARCPYCRGYHPANLIQQCPLRPRH